MAGKSTLDRAARRIAEALWNYARGKGWNAPDFEVYRRVNSKWNTIHVIVVSKHFNNTSDFQKYADVRNYLEAELANEPGLLDLLSLDVRSAAQVEEGGIYEIGPEYRELSAASHS